MKYISQNNYEKKYVIRITFKLNKKYDKDIIEEIDTTNKSGWVKSMIRKGIEYDKRLERLNK